MIIKFTEDRVLMVPVEQGAAQVRILPGVNEIPDNRWAKARTLLAAKLSGGSIEEIGAHKKGGNGADKDSVVGKKFSEFEISDARKIIAGTNIPGLLEEWRASSKSEEVRLEIANRLNFLDKEKEKARTGKAARTEAEKA